MLECLAVLIRRRRWPFPSGLAELDLQIEKLRMLRDSYRASLQEQRQDGTVASQDQCPRYISST
ncbi:MAG: hypothetical protein RW306_16670 [Geobacteraceae bacterium]|nr:hypothetical protein [Geobacteraceae bacterium]